MKKNNNNNPSTLQTACSEQKSIPHSRSILESQWLLMQFSVKLMRLWKKESFLMTRGETKKVKTARTRVQKFLTCEEQIKRHVSVSLHVQSLNYNHTQSSFTHRSLIFLWNTNADADYLHTTDDRQSLKCNSMQKLE